MGRWVGGFVRVGVAVAVVMAFTGTVGVAGGSERLVRPAYEVPEDPEPVPEAEDVGDAMLGIETGVATSATGELFGWTLSALGINEGGGDLEIDDELDEIYDQLVDIDTELDDIDDELKLQTCELDAAETTFDATTQINFWEEKLEQMQSAGVTTEQLDQFVDGVLDADTDSITYSLVAIDDALMDSGSIPGVISSCLAVLDTPTDGTAGDLDYYDQVDDLTTYFYGVQVQGLNQVVEAYHLLATQAYYEGSSPATITTETLNTICTLAVPDTTAYTYCNDAAYWVAVVYENLQDQLSFAGAPYSVDDAALTVNGTDFVFVQSLETYSDAQGSTCTSPLDSSDPCGPLAGTNLTTDIAPDDTYAWRTDWVVAPAEAWAAALTWWTDDDDTLGTYLDDLGFANTTNSTKVVVTGTTYTAEPEEVLDGEEKPLFSEDAVCFVDTAIERGKAHQPWCYNGSSDGVDYGLASDLVSDLSGDDCTHWTASSTYTSADTSDFFEGTYAYGDTCSEVGWVDGVHPGWILDAGASATQYLWPVFDMSTATCNTNLSGLARSTTNPQGVFTMCGDDFDLWFDAVVPEPETTDVVPAASVSSTTSGGTLTVTSGAWDIDASITVTANSEPLRLDQTTTDYAGRLEKTYTLPPDFPVGAHTLTLAGVRRGRPYTLVVPFTVVPAPTFTG